MYNNNVRLYTLDSYRGSLFVYLSSYSIPINAGCVSHEAARVLRGRNSHGHVHTTAAIRAAVYRLDKPVLLRIRVYIQVKLVICRQTCLQGSI